MTLFSSLFNHFTCILYFWFCRFHVEICVFLLSLVVLPTRGICFMLVNWFFLANEVVFYSEYFTISHIQYDDQTPFHDRKSILNGCCNYFTEFLKYGEKCWGVSLSPIPMKENGPSRVSYKEILSRAYLWTQSLIWVTQCIWYVLKIIFNHEILS